MAQKVLPSSLSVKALQNQVRTFQNLETHLYLTMATCLLPFAFCLLPLAFCLLPFASCLLPLASCLLPLAFCLLPLASCLLPKATCLLPLASCLLPPRYNHESQYSVTLSCDITLKIVYSRVTFKLKSG